MKTADIYEVKTSKKILLNLGAPELYERALAAKEGVLTETGAFAADTGRHTARAAQDKYLVREEFSEKNVWWSDYNVGIEPEKFYTLLEKMKKYLSNKDVYLRKCAVGTAPAYRMKLNVYTELAWHSLFAKDLFVEISENFEKPDFTIIVAPGFKANPPADGVKSETFIIVNLKERVAIIGGTGYGGEIKKTAFSVMNYFLPLSGVFPMHCSANLGSQGDTAVFFGLSGTGKTTLSSAPGRRLIGDDEHGWSDQGIFNFEGGCYAKVINLSQEAEPQIYAAVNKFSSVLENVVLTAGRKVDFSDDSKTENTRAGYPLSFIDNSIRGEIFPAPKNIIMLAYDAFGVLPPVARLDYGHAMYHFISGYTAKVANTEIGIKEPKATFSACFGAPFMSHHPKVYAAMLMEKMKKSGASCWLINTGLTGGPYGIGKRMSIKHTREILNFALEGDHSGVKFYKDPVFGFEIPEKFGNVGKEVLDPAFSWKNKEDYKAKYRELAGMFRKNFSKFGIDDPVTLAGAPL